MNSSSASVPERSGPSSSMRHVKNEAKEKTKEADDEDLPLIFKCIDCDTIFGDSTRWVRDDQNLKTITLSRATRKILISDQLLHSLEGSDIGCSYVLLKCGNCQTDVGRMYRTTGRNLDDLRDLYTFDIARIDTYEIGQTDASCKPEEVLVVSAAGGPVNNRSFSSRPRAAEMKKLQSELVSVTARLTSLESRCLHVSDVVSSRDAITPLRSRDNVRDIDVQRSDSGASAPKRGKLS